MEILGGIIFILFILGYIYIKGYVPAEYDELARNPSRNIGKNTSFKGQIIQVIRRPEYSNFIIAIGGDLDNIMMLEIDNSKLGRRILVDDVIKFDGKFTGEFTYDSMEGAKSVPHAVVDKFKFCIITY